MKKEYELPNGCILLRYDNKPEYDLDENNLPESQVKWSGKFCYVDRGIAEKYFGVRGDAQMEVFYRNVLTSSMKWGILLNKKFKPNEVPGAVRSVQENESVPDEIRRVHVGEVPWASTNFGRNQ